LREIGVLVQNTLDNLVGLDVVCLSEVLFRFDLSKVEGLALVKDFHDRDFLDHIPPRLTGVQGVVEGRKRSLAVWRPNLVLSLYLGLSIGQWVAKGIAVIKICLKSGRGHSALIVLRCYNQVR
jgi:hypothetical protein